MQDFKFTKAQLEKFLSRGFEVYKDSNGKYFIKPAIVNTLKRREEAVENAQKCGLVLTTNLEVLYFNNYGD